MNNVHIIENHDMALEIWRKYGVYDSILIHVDAHPDYVLLKDACYINIGNYLTYAVSEQRFKKCYWVLPDIFWENATYARIIMNQLPSCFEVVEINERTIRLKNVEFPRIDFMVVGINSAFWSKDEFQHDDSVCVDIDIDYMMNPKISQVYSYTYPTKNWCTAKDLFSTLFPLIKNHCIITIANSFYGGYTPLLQAYLSEYLHELFCDGMSKKSGNYSVLEKGLSLLVTSDYEEAINCFNQIKAPFFSCLSAQIGLLYSYLFMGNILAAKEVYSFLETHYKNYEAYFFPVSGLLFNKQFGLVEQAIEQWLQVENLSEQANLYFLKYAYLSDKNCNESIINECASKITDLGTDYEKSYVLGNIYLLKYEYQKAIDSFNSVLTFLRDNCTPVWCGQISSFEKKKNHGMIIAEIYEKLIEAYEGLGNYKIARKYAMICKKMGKYNEKIKQVLLC